MKAYISGPMHGVPDHNKPLFREATVHLRSNRDFDKVVNPHEEFDDDTSRPWTTYMEYDLKTISKCDCLILLPGWDNPDAVGVRTELAYAISVGHVIAEYHPEGPGYRLVWWPPFDAREAVKAIINGRQVLLGVPLHVEHASKKSKTILQEADEIVSGDRQKDYGHPLDNFERIAALWEPILGIDITPEEVGACMIALKLSRLVATPDHRDSIVDIAGYARGYELVLEERARRKVQEERLMEVIRQTYADPNAPLPLEVLGVE